MTPEQKAAKRRRLYFFAVSALATVITLVSASATWELNKRSFADWPEVGAYLAILATIGIEATFVLALLGLTYVFVGRIEQGIGIALLIGTLAVMAANYVTHHKMTVGARLNNWQMDYIQWTGPLTLFGILALIVAIIMFNQDTRERILDRAYSFASRCRVSEWRQEQLNSPEFDQYMERFKPQVFETARQSLNLPALPAAKQKPGFHVDDDAPKTPSSLD